MADEKLDSRLERAVSEFRDYLSDQVPPMIVADSMALLLKCPPDLVASNIYAWVVSQQRSSRAIPASDYFFHAIKKIHLMAEYNLVSNEELSAFLSKVKPLVLSYCPAGERETLRHNLEHMEDIPTTLSAPVEVVYRQTSTDVPRPGTGIPEQGKEVDVQRLNLLMSRLEKELGTIQKTEKSDKGVSDSQKIVQAALAEAAISARKSVELEQSLEMLKKLGINAGTEDVFRALGRNVPEWSLPERPDVQMPEDSNIKAMHRIVAQAQDPKEGAVRFHQMVRAAIERFNEGHLTQAASMIDLAEKIIAAKEVEEPVSQNLRKRGHESLDIEKMGRKYVENPDQHHLLRKVMAFFNSLRPEGLLESLRLEPKRDRRKLLLALLECHRESTRAACSNYLQVPPQANSGEDEIYFRRNLLYLLRRIPPEPSENQDELAEIAARHADLVFPTLLVKEAIAYLGQLKQDKAEKALIALMTQVESLLLASDHPYDVKELHQLLDRISASLAKVGSPATVRALVEHALKKKPKHGDTMSRLSELSVQDLSNDMQTVDRLLSALKANLPKKVLGLVVQQRDQDLKSIVEALSGTSLQKVRKALEEVAQQFPDSPAGQTAKKVLKTPHLAAATTAVPKRSMETPVQSSNVAAGSSLTGDLDLFGLPALFQSLADNTVTGNLALKNPAGTAFASVGIENGKLRSCKFGPLTGDLAFYQLFERPQPGTFQFTRSALQSGEPDAVKEILPMLMEGIRRYDELSQLTAILPDKVRLKAKSAQPTKLPEEKDGLLFRELWNAVRSGATPMECEAMVAVDAYRVRRLLVHWIETGAVETLS